MKGFELTINGEKIEGAISEGITSIILSCKNNQYTINFGSMDNTGMLTYTWFSSSLEQGSKLKVVSKEVAVTSNPIEIRDYNNKEQIDQLELESYFKLRDELIKEGLIDGQDK